MARRPKYLTQPPIELPCCQLLTGLNALRYYGHTTPEPGDPIFDYLVDLAECRHGGATNVESAWWDLGLVWETKPLHINEIGWWVCSGIPVSITALLPDGTAHMGLVVGIDGDDLHIVNWYSNHPVAKVKLQDLDIPDVYREIHVFAPIRR